LGEIDHENVLKRRDLTFQRGPQAQSGTGLGPLFDREQA
jgi:hypothetical protein